MYRAAEIFQAKKVIIVSQEYHLYRAVYIARALGLDACGAVANPREYTLGTDIYNNVRESAARVKDFFNVIAKPEPTYLGDVIPISGKGSATDDRK